MSVCSAIFTTALAQRKQAREISSLTANQNRIVLVNPYLDPATTPFALDMRRKAEVLKYTKSTGASITKSKSTSWADVARQTTGRRTSLQLCTADPPPNQATLARPTEYSNVPRGNVRELYLDPSVALYRFIDPTTTRNYTEFTDVLPDPVLTQVLDQVSLIPSLGTAPIATSGVVVSSCYFTVTSVSSLIQVRAVCPVAVRFTGNTSARPSASTVAPTVLVTLQVHVFYNEQPIAPTIRHTQTVSLDFPLVPGFAGATSSGDFDITKYIALLDVPGMTAYAASGYVYTVRVSGSVRFPLDFDLSKVNAVLYGNIPVTFSDDPHAVFLTATPAPPTPIPPSSITVS